MKVLEITFIPPGRMSGGEIGIYQSIKSLLENADVDYIGPKFNDDVKLDNLNIISFLKPQKTFFVKSFFRFIFKMVSTSFYDSYCEAIKNIDVNQYDYIHIESTRYWFVVKKLDPKKTIVRIHNIEANYGKSLFLKKKSISNLMRYYSYKLNERKVIKHISSAVFLTNEEKEYAVNSLKFKGESFINPVCIDRRIEDLKVNSENKINFLITGSLGFGPNLDGIIWFVNKVWLEGKFNLNEDISLTIAGSNPNDEFISLCKDYKIELVNSPKVIDPYFEKADYYVSPIFSGAGMKVKVADAFSFGIPVIGTTHSFIGYDDMTIGKINADTQQEFISCLHDIIADKKIFNREDILNGYKKYYSIESSIDRYKSILKEKRNTKNDN